MQDCLLNKSNLGATNAMALLVDLLPEDKDVDLAIVMSVASIGR